MSNLNKNVKNIVKDLLSKDIDDDEFDFLLEKVIEENKFKEKPKKKRQLLRGNEQIEK